MSTESSGSNPEVDGAQQKTDYCEAIWNSIYDGDPRYDMVWEKMDETAGPIHIWVGTVTEQAVSNTLVMAAFCLGSSEYPNIFGDEDNRLARLFTPEEWDSFVDGVMKGEFDPNF